VRDYVTCEHLKWLLPLADVYTKIVRSAKLGQCQPYRIDESWEPEVIKRQGPCPSPADLIWKEVAPWLDVQKICVLTKSCSKSRSL